MDIGSIYFIIIIAVFVVAATLICLVTWCCQGSDDTGSYRSKSSFVDLEDGYNNVDEEKGDGKWSRHAGGTTNIVYVTEAEVVSVKKSTTVCEYCSKKFRSVSALTNHQRDTKFAKCRFKIYTELALSDNVKLDVKQLCNKASLNQDTYHSCKRLVIDLLSKLLQHRSNCGRFDEKPDREGSTKTGLKTRKAVEFDFSVRLKLKETPDFEFSSVGHYTYGEQIPADCAKVFLGASDRRRFGECCPNGELLPTELRSVFHNFLTNAAATINTSGVKVTVCRNINGPAVRLILKGRGIPHHIDVDLTPKIVIPELDPNIRIDGFKWPREDTFHFLRETIPVVEKQQLYLVPKKEKFWTISFANYETEILSSFPNNSTEKKILRCLKVKLEAWKTKSPVELKAVSSYLLKQVFFWLREKLPRSDHWSEDRCAERYFNFVQELKFCFIHEHLPEYFVPATNLMKGKDKARATMIKYLDEELTKKNEFYES